MKIFGYGEDALTLWALENRLSSLLEQVEDTSPPEQCKVFFRPSFGRRGGENSSQFGEFDFILLSSRLIYLGESKWHRSSEKIQNNILALREEQLLRHEIFRFYVQEWAFGNSTDWAAFAETAWINLGQKGKKPIAPAGSLLAANLQTVLEIIRQHFSMQPPVLNMLLYLHNGTGQELPQHVTDADFKVVNIDYSTDCCENFIRL